MFRLSEKVKKIEDKINTFITDNKSKLPTYIGLGFLILYCYGMVVRCIGVGVINFRNATNEEWFTLNPFKNIGAIFTPYGMMITIFVVLMYCLFSKKGYQLLSGYKTVRDKERGIEILPEGTHGTSGWMNKNELSEVLVKGSLDTLDETLFGKLENGEYVSLKDMRGMNKNIIIYGSPGTGKSRGFVMPFAMQAVKRGESLIMVDPKAEFYEMYSEFFREQGYTVCAYNLLDLFASDGWNCVTETANDLNLVQNVAEIIIRNTSSESDKDDFWAKAEKNLLMALLHYVGTLVYPGTDKLLPVEERSLGTIYAVLERAVFPLLSSRKIKRSSGYLFSRNGKLSDKIIEAIDIMLLLGSDANEPYIKGKMPFVLTFFKQRDGKLWRYDICPVTYGIETVISAQLENISTKYRMLVFVLEKEEQMQGIRANCEHCYVLKNNGEYEFYLYSKKGE